MSSAYFCVASTHISEYDVNGYHSLGHYFLFFFFSQIHNFELFRLVFVCDSMTYHLERLNSSK